MAWGSYRKKASTAGSFDMGAPKSNVPKVTSKAAQRSSSTALGRAASKASGSFDQTTTTTLGSGALAKSFGSALGNAIKGPKSMVERKGTFQKAPDGSTLFTNTSANSRTGAQYSKVDYKGSTYHVYYDADGKRKVVKPK